MGRYAGAAPGNNDGLLRRIISFQSPRVPAEWIINKSLAPGHQILAGEIGTGCLTNNSPATHRPVHTPTQPDSLSHPPLQTCAHRHAPARTPAGSRLREPSLVTATPAPQPRTSAPVSPRLLSSRSTLPLETRLEGCARWPTKGPDCGRSVASPGKGGARRQMGGLSRCDPQAPPSDGW